MEVVEGILSNDEANKKCLLFVRDIICNDETKEKLAKAGYFNKNKIDDTELENLKQRAKLKLLDQNIVVTKVMLFFIFH